MEPDISAAPVKLFLLSYDAGSRRATLRPLPPAPMPATFAGGSHPGTWLAAEALSADGTRLAIVVATAAAGFDVQVYALATGAVTDWAGPAPGPPNPDWEFSLTWLDDNRTLAIGAGNGFRFKISPFWYLDTSAPGGELAAASRTVTLAFPKAKPTTWNGPHTPARCEVPIATSDGQTLLCSGTADFPQNAAGGTSVGIWVFSARTGKLTAALEQRTICCIEMMSTVFPRIVWASPKGDILIVTGITDPNYGTQLFVRAPDGRRTQIPWPGGIIHYPGIVNPYEPDVAW